jgi:hypothetical protein
MSAAGAITVVRDAQRRALTKRYHLRGDRLAKSNYPNVAEVFAEEVPVDGIDSLADVLERVSAGGTAAVIRGAPGRFFPRNGSPAFRLLRPQEGQAAAATGARISPEQIKRNKLEPDGVHRYAATWLPTFEECPRRWVIFDVDRIPVPEHLAGDWVDEPEAGVEHVLGTLPAPFRTATCWWSLSSSAAVPGPNGREVAAEFKLKLAFWLDRPLTGAQSDRWMRAEQAPVDPAVFRTVQLIYIAQPGFGPGLHDPIPQRSGTWQGEDDVVSVPELLPEPPAFDYETEAAEFGSAESLEELCAALRARLEGELHVREHLLQAARAYVRQHGTRIDQAKLTEALEAVAREHRSRDEVAGYGVDRIVDHVVQKERAAGRSPQRAVMLPYFDPEAENRFREANNQRRFIREWLRRNCQIALARREYAVLRAAAFADEGIT